MEIIKYIQSFSNPFLDTFFVLFTNLGGQTLGLILTIYFLWFKDKRYGYSLGFSVSISLLINNIIKIFVNSPRPIGEEGIRTLAKETATGTSFPSGHSQGNAATFTSLILHFKSKPIIIIGIIMMILIPISRLYLGVHWPIDVVFGSLFGILSVFLSNFIFEYIEKTDKSYIYLIISAVAIISTIFLNTEDYLKSAGALSALCIGYVIDKKYTNYNPTDCDINPIIKLIVGLGGTAALFFLIDFAMPHLLIKHFIKYFVVAVYAIIISPILFKCIKNKLRN